MSHLTTITYTDRMEYSAADARRLRVTVILASMSTVSMLLLGAIAAVFWLAFDGGPSAITLMVVGVALGLMGAVVVGLNQPRLQRLQQINGSIASLVRELTFYYDIHDESNTYRFGKPEQGELVVTGFGTEHGQELLKWRVDVYAPNGSVPGLGFIIRPDRVESIHPANVAMLYSSELIARLDKMTALISSQVNFGSMAERTLENNSESPVSIFEDHEKK